MIDRKSYSRIKRGAELPNLLEIQTRSYELFLQPDTPPRLRQKQGLHGSFLSLFPVNDVKGYYSLEYDGYKLGIPKYSLKECKERGMTYAAPLKVDMSLLVYEQDGETKKFVEKISNEVYIGEIPLMTQRGTFVINGAERVIVSQLHRSPGITFDEVIHPNGKKLLTARIIPQRGSWVELLLDVDDILTVNIDRRKKMPATILLRAMGYSSDEEILGLFYDTTRVKIVEDKTEDILGSINAKTVFNEETGEIIIDANEVITEDKFKILLENQVQSVEILKDVPNPENMIIRNTLASDPTKSEEEALFYMYATMRPGDPPNVETAINLIQRLFFDEKRYDLGNVGRYRINTRLGVAPPEGVNTLTEDDIIASYKYITGLSAGVGFIDDIDHLGNRRVRSVGELLAAQFTVGLTRMVRTIKERLSLRDTENITPQDLINARTVSTVVQAFFGSSQLSQFLDQTNPLSELTHKRRVSALGPGGLTRERAGFEVRDVHHTHYGRLCPIETPEGPNIGLIASLSTFARVNEFGFIETPYQKVEEGKLTGEIVYLTADQEDNYIIAQANTPTDENGVIEEDMVFARYRGDFPVVPPQEISYMDISPMQLVSIAAGLIPFLEHDDANRALMGSNMQRQAVPLLTTEPPFVGTGLESRAAVDSGCMIIAKNSGVVEKVDANKIVVRKVKDETTSDVLGLTEFDTYELVKYERSNQDTCINQKVCVKAGQEVKAGDVLADGHATKEGELSLGRNVMVAFMPWRGYNFEDAIVVSERLVAEDVYTSVHIEVFETDVRDTKRGPEELTREIPNVSEEALKNLDENGVVRVGTEVEAGDILVGKVTPKGETELSPEERLLRAIFGEKAGDVRDSSLKAPPGLKGVVVDTRVYSRKERDKRSKKKDKARIDELKAEITQQITEIERIRLERLAEFLSDTETKEITNFHTGEVIIPEGEKWTKAILQKLDYSSISFRDGLCQDSEKNSKAEEVLYRANDLIAKYEDKLDKEIDKVVRGDELKPGVLQLVKVYVAKKRKLSVGDKMAGRHGNKGVISKILPVEELPFLPDGTTVDIILNPLGVPSRMNVGQILETHMGWAAKELDLKISTAVFDGASYSDVIDLLEEAGLPKNGKVQLRDGRSGEPFHHEVTVGPIYMLKLCHLVDDKIHARSIGPYSLVTQQPLGGKSQFGGQRFGEMEVWALEAYGAAYTLQQVLTVKSDDLSGRSKIYEAIVKGENAPPAGIPESFKVLVREIKALALDIDVLTDEDTAS
ncbi:DNA-directed RNA polymerase subunit beta [Chitinispirillales bacterium ANBcel5]|uniref:DNA-directed RNA polymerase subunit beta n=1 Tax=Cellulosispirillum alkaliphilum TaxID=3039283 RepID=UPI002A528E26|nr:DNA-directed RNA polymerase subunit beta [Chitinispirillales bacterium ANBcel5]